MIVNSTIRLSLSSVDSDGVNVLVSRIGCSIIASGADVVFSVGAEDGAALASGNFAVDGATTATFATDDNCVGSTGVEVKFSTGRAVAVTVSEGDANGTGLDSVAAIIAGCEAIVDSATTGDGDDGCGSGDDR